jgi:phosphoglycerate dehydrogenase-like enzyme
MLKGLYLLDSHWQRRVYPEAFDRELAGDLVLAAPPQSAASIRSNPSVLAEIDVIFSGWGMPRVDADFLVHAPRLRAVFHAAGTIRYFATPELWARGITVFTASEINAGPVAEYTLAAVLFGLRHGWQHATAARAQGHFDPDRSLPGAYRSTVALVSLGAVARQLRERLRAFDVHVIACDPFCSAETADALDVELVSLEECFRRGDIVSLHTPLLPETTGMIRGEHFAAMKPRATFINTARGAVVREPEMIAVLERRSDLHAVLDVTEPEPPVPGSPLYRLPNVTLTPHIAGTCEAEASRLGRAMLDEFHRWRRGAPLRYAITEAQAARLA